MKSRFSKIALCATLVSLATLSALWLTKQDHAKSLSDGQVLETIYGPVKIHEPVLWDLINSAPMQRLKKIHQYGVGHMMNDKEWYSRYDHSIGVFAILRKKGFSIQEQVAGLLHDVSHTAFSHFGDIFFSKIDDKESYQDTIHLWYLEKSGLKKILSKHGFTLHDIDHKNGLLTGLERDLPHLCADRIDYNLQGGYLRGALTKKEMGQILEDLQFDGKDWNLGNIALAEKLSDFSVRMTLECWSAPDQYMGNIWLGEAIKRAIEKDILTLDSVFFGTDDQLWNALRHSLDPVIQDYIYRILHPRQFFSLTDTDGDINMPVKFRGIDPLIRIQGDKKRLTELSAEYSEKFTQVKAQTTRGWKIKLR